jgi:hypothetical protein
MLGTSAREISWRRVEEAGCSSWGFQFELYIIIPSSKSHGNTPYGNTPFKFAASSLVPLCTHFSARSESTQTSFPQLSFPQFMKAYGDAEYKEITIPPSHLPNANPPRMH